MKHASTHPGPVHPAGRVAVGHGGGRLGRPGDEAAAIVIAFVSVWLILSAFAWPHAPHQATSSVIVGIAGIAIALASLLVDPRIRFAGALLAAWLFISVWWLPGGKPATAYNDLIVAGVVFIAAVSAGAGSASRP